jgi:hypothetical protein
MQQVPTTVSELAQGPLGHRPHPEQSQSPAPPTSTARSEASLCSSPPVLMTTYKPTGVTDEEQLPQHSRTWRGQEWALELVGAQEGGAGPGAGALVGGDNREEEDSLG